MKKSIFSFSALLLVFSSFAQTTSWTGASDSTWHNPANWTAGVPTDTIDVVIGDANYSGTYHPALMAAASCKALTLGAGFKLKVYTNDTIKLSGSLVNNGLIQGDSAKFAFVANNVTLCGNGTAVYKSLTILPGVSFTINKNIALSGNLVVDGSLSSVGKAISFVGSTSSVISGSGSIVLGDIVQNKTNACTRLESPVMLTGSLNLLSGVVHTSPSGLLSLADNATSTSGNNSSYVDGPMEKLGDDAFVFPLGDNGVWARLGISSPTLASDGFVAQYHAGAYVNTDSIVPSVPLMYNVSKLEYWTCERSAGNANVSVTLYWEDSERSDLHDLISLVVAHWNGSAWENAGNTAMVPLNQGSITSSVQTAFSPFTFGSTSNANPMPIGLSDFSVALDANNNAKLKWQTATETNNKFFSVEKSQDGINYETITTIEGAGTSLVEHTYSCTDSEPFEGLTYYRLKQTDFNGNFKYSSVKTVQVTNDRTDVEVYPNPSNGQTFSVGLTETSKVTRIILCNAMGQQVLEMEVPGAEAVRIEVVVPAALPPGVYTLLALGDDRNYKKKLVVEAK